MTEKTLEQERPTRTKLRKLGPRGVPGEPDNPKMTPWRDKRPPEVGNVDGHPA